MNLENNPSALQLREMIRQCDDAAGHHVLWVNKDGDVLISQIPAEQSPHEFEQSHPDIQLRVQTFQRGNEYVGPEAAEDDEWITELFGGLESAWRNAKGKQEVAFVDMI